MPADLLSNLIARLRASSTHEHRLVSLALGTLEGVRGGDSFGRRWERRIATGPGDVDRDWHLTRQHSAIEPHDWKVTTACNGAWRFDDHVEQTDNPPLPERCTTCWRAAVQGDPLALALIDAWLAMEAEDRRKAGEQERARDEMVPLTGPAVRSPLGVPLVLSTALPDEPEWHCPNSSNECAIRRRCTQWTCPNHPRRSAAVSIGHVPGDGGDPMPLGPMPRRLAVVEEPDDVAHLDARDEHAGEGR